MTKDQLSQLGKTLWATADDLRGAMSADDSRDYMLTFLFLRYLSDITTRQPARRWGRTIHSSWKVIVVRRCRLGMPATPKMWPSLKSRCAEICTTAFTRIICGAVFLNTLFGGHGGTRF